MSRVTINDLNNDYKQIVYFRGCAGFERETEQLYKVENIEVVPRKMVEMIIEKCREIQRDNNNDDDRHECGKWCASDEIKEYAASLLRQFEED